PNSWNASREFQTRSRPIATIRSPTDSAASPVVERKARSLNDRRPPARRRAVAPGARAVWAVIGYLAARKRVASCSTDCSDEEWRAPVAVRAPRPAPLEEESEATARSAIRRW